MKISVVSPVYQAQNIVDELVVRLVSELQKITNDYEIFLVDDGSSDNSWEKISENCILNSNIKGIKLSKNFGQHSAILAGTLKASGDFIVIIDCDLQDDPKYIKTLTDEFKKGYDVVFTKRKNNNQNIFKRFSSVFFSLLINFFSKDKLHKNTGSLLGFGKNIQFNFNKFKDRDRQTVQILKWLGYNSTIVETEHFKRFEGKSTYTISALFKLALQGLINHTDRLLKYTIFIGCVLSLLSIFSALLLIIRYFSGSLDIVWTSVIVSVVVAILFSTGLILMSIGILGVYIGKIFLQARNRPLFIIDKEINLKNF